MADRCNDCGKLFGLLLKKHICDDGKIRCYECYDKYLKLSGKDLPATEKNYGIVMQLVLGIMGLMVLILCIIAGADMMTLRSVAGNSVAEAYYNAVGLFVVGMGFFAGPLLWGIAYLIRKK